MAKDTLPISAEEVQKHFCQNGELDTYQVDYFVGGTETIAHVFVSMCPYGQVLARILVWSIGNDYEVLTPRKGTINKYNQPDREKEWDAREKRCYTWVANQLNRLAREYDGNGNIVPGKYVTVEMWKQHTE